MYFSKDALLSLCSSHRHSLVKDALVVVCFGVGRGERESWHLYCIYDTTSRPFTPSPPKVYFHGDFGELYTYDITWCTCCRKMASVVLLLPLDPSRAGDCRWFLIICLQDKIFSSFDMYHVVALSKSALDE